MAGLSSLYTHRDLLRNLVQRELRTRYRRSVLGWIWAMLNPALTTGVYYFVFTYVFKAQPPPGNPSGNHYFVFFLLAATLPWNLLASGLVGGIGSILGAGSLITRVYFPRELIPTATVLSMTVSLLIELSVLLVLQLPFGFVAFKYVPVALLLVGLQTFFVVGLALWLSALNVRYRDVQHLIGVVILIWFYLTPCLYSPEFIPEKLLFLGIHDFPLRDVLGANPMSLFVRSYRNVFYDLRLPSAASMIGCVVYSTTAFFLGSRFFRKRSRRFAEEM